jgi:hypothetical protein
MVRALIRVLAALDRINTRMEDFADPLHSESSLVQELLDAQGAFEEKPIRCLNEA